MSPGPSRPKPRVKTTKSVQSPTWTPPPLPPAPEVPPGPVEGEAPIAQPEVVPDVVETSEESTPQMPEAVTVPPAAFGEQDENLNPYALPMMINPQMAPFLSQAALRAILGNLGPRARMRLGGASSYYNPFI